MTDDLRWLWASTIMKDALPRQNIQTELVLSDPEQPDLLSCTFLRLMRGNLTMILFIISISPLGAETIRTKFVFFCEFLRNTG